jgi:hypothetical protein
MIRLSQIFLPLLLDIYLSTILDIAQKNGGMRASVNHVIKFFI